MVSGRHKHLQYNDEQECAWYDEESNSSGALSSRLNNDTSSIRGAVGDQLGLLSQNLVTFIVGYIIAFINGCGLVPTATAQLPILMDQTHSTHCLMV